MVDTRQYNNGSDIIVADVENRCIRKLNRQTRLVTIFAGDCPVKGEVTEPVKADKATLSLPYSILYHQERDIFYYLLIRPSSIVEHNITKGIYKKFFIWFVLVYRLLLLAKMHVLFRTFEGTERFIVSKS